MSVNPVRWPLLVFLAVGVTMQAFLIYLNHILVGSDPMLTTARVEANHAIAILVVTSFAATAVIAALWKDGPMYAGALGGWAFIGISQFYTDLPSLESSGYRWGLVVQVTAFVFAARWAHLRRERRRRIRRANLVLDRMLDQPNCNHN